MTIDSLRSPNCIIFIGDMTVVRLDVVVAFVDLLGEELLKGCWVGDYCAVHGDVDIDLWTRFQVKVCKMFSRSRLV